MATHSSILAWRIPWKEEPGGLQSTGLQSRTQLTDLISHKYMYISSLLRLSPLFPTHPSRSSQSAWLGSLCYIATSH